MNRETAWMIRQDGKAFACTSHYYADSEDAEDTLYAAEWLYKHTARCGTKCLILNLISVYAEGLREAGLKIVDIHDLKELALKSIGVPDPLPFGEKVVGVVMNRDGSVMDVIMNIED